MVRSLNDDIWWHMMTYSTQLVWDLFMKIMLFWQMRFLLLTLWISILRGTCSTANAILLISISVCRKWMKCKLWRRSTAAMCEACWQAHDLTIQSVVEAEVCASQVLVDSDGAVVAKNVWSQTPFKTRSGPLVSHWHQTSKASKTRFPSNCLVVLKLHETVTIKYHIISSNIHQAAGITTPGVMAAPGSWLISRASNLFKRWEKLVWFLIWWSLDDLLIIFYDFADVGILNEGQHKANFAEFTWNIMKQSKSTQVYDGLR